MTWRLDPYDSQDLLQESANIHRGPEVFRGGLTTLPASIMKRYREMGVSACSEFPPRCAALEVDVQELPSLDPQSGTLPRDECRQTLEVSTSKFLLLKICAGQNGSRSVSHDASHSQSMEGGNMHLV